MIIRRVLNNNAISCLDEVGNEVIVKGKGIAFQANPGDLVDPKRIEKKFVLENQEINRRFQEILITIPEDCIETSEAIITMIKAEIDKPISDTIYITLTDHISNLLERIQLGIAFDNSLLWDIKRMYRKEYDIALKAVAILRQHMHLKLDNDEASFITLHIVNAQLDLDMKEVYVVTAMIDKIYTMLESQYDLSTVNEDDIIYNRFILHLRFFLERMSQSKEVMSKNDDLLSIMKGKYPKQYESVCMIAKLICDKYKNEVSSDERLYLLIHIVKLTIQ